MAIDFPDAPSVGDLHPPTGTPFQWQWDGVSWNRVAGPGNLAVLRTVVFTANGNYVKPANAGSVMVECWGGGGGGGGAEASLARGIGGAGGGYSQRFYQASELDASEAIVVGPGGAGGAAGTPGSNGATGGQTTFKGLVAGGGVGGLPGAAGAQPGVIGGAASGGDVNITGGASSIKEDTNYVGVGGDSPRGGAGGKSNVTQPGVAPGGGGSAGNHVGGGPGANGAGGLVFITEYGGLGEV